MTATNHVVTGIAIVALVPNPAISLPLAFLAHFALDALPHFGDRKHRSKSLDRLRYVLPIDMALAAVPAGSAPAWAAVTPCGLPVLFLWAMKSAMAFMIFPKATDNFSPLVRFAMADAWE